jgi:hypothetical protein
VPTPLQVPSILPSANMCKHCSHLLHSLATKHTEMECPLRRSLHCCICLTTGHSHTNCPNKQAVATRKALNPLRLPPLQLRAPDDREKLQKYLKTACKGHPPTHVNKMRSMVHEYAYSQKPPRMVSFTNEFPPLTLEDALCE